MEINDGLELGGVLRPASMTSTDRDALASLPGTDAHLLFNTTNGRLEATYDGGSNWGEFGTPDYYRYSVYSTVNHDGVGSNEFVEQDVILNPGTGGVTVLHQSGTAPTIATTGDRQLTIPVTGIARVRYMFTSQHENQVASTTMEMTLRVDGSDVCRSWLGGGGPLRFSSELEYLGPVTPTTEFSIESTILNTVVGTGIDITNTTLVIEQVA